jgi:hypothetical protein
MENTHRAIRLHVEHSLCDHSQTASYQSNTFTGIDGYIFNLINIVADIGCDHHSPFLHERSHRTPTNSIHSLLQIVAYLGGAFGPLVNVWRSRLDQAYFQRWYLDRHAYVQSINDNNCTIDDTNTEMTEKSTDTASAFITIHRLVPTRSLLKSETEKRIRKEIERIYGIDHDDTESVASSRHSPIEEKDFADTNVPYKALSPISLNPISDWRGQPCITVREYHPKQEKASLFVDKSISPTSSISISAKDTHLSNEDMFSQYGKYFRHYPNVNNNSNPEIIKVTNPDQRIYKQQIGVRYLIPPTPPMPGPLIIRGIHL